MVFRFYTGAGFAENGQVAQADGTWLRYSQRLKNQAGRRGKSNGQGRGRKSKAAERRVASINKVFGRLTFEEVEQESEV